MELGAKSRQHGSTMFEQSVLLYACVNSQFASIVSVYIILHMHVIVYIV